VNGSFGGATALLNLKAIMPHWAEFTDPKYTKPWDSTLSIVLGRRCHYSTVSYAQHLGLNGIHIKPHNMRKEMASIKTDYLNNVESDLLNQLGWAA
jgi:hypothetical protein